MQLFSHGCALHCPTRPQLPSACPRVTHGTWVTRSCIQALHQGPGGSAPLLLRHGVQGALGLGSSETPTRVGRQLRSCPGARPLQQWSEIDTRQRCVCPGVRPASYHQAVMWPGGCCLFSQVCVVSPPGSSVHGILQARILEAVAIPFSRRSSRPRDRTQVSHFAGRFLTVWASSGYKTRWEGRETATLQSVKQSIVAFYVWGEK